MTHHIGHFTDHPQIDALWIIVPEITVGHIHNHPTNVQGMNHIDQVYIPSGQEEVHILRRI